MMMPFFFSYKKIYLTANRKKAFRKHFQAAALSRSIPLSKSFNWFRHRGRVDDEEEEEVEKEEEQQQQEEDDEEDDDGDDDDEDEDNEGNDGNDDDDDNDDDIFFNVIVD